ncbi:MAG TPA: hypothetical protein VIJ65_03315 [Acidobacteriaceae bacterium]
MRIDATHKPWLWFTLVAIAVSAIAYVTYAQHTGTSGGGTSLGLVFGSLALACMIFAALLSLRKRFPIWRIGRTRLWLKAHLWLGFLALPLVLFHAAFHARGLLALILLLLTIVVVASGIFGAWLQHTLPSRMFREVPYETIYDQIDVIRAQLADEAARHAADVTQRLAPARGAGATVVLTMLTVPELGDEVAAFDNFYQSQAAPYLRADRRAAKQMELFDREAARQQFESYRKLFPQSAWPAIESLEDICEEKRELDHQIHLHHWLHSWLLIHLPLSAALLVLACIHAVIALHY